MPQQGASADPGCGVGRAWEGPLVKLKIAWIGKTKEPAINSLTAEYLKRISRYAPVESLELASEAALLKQLEKSNARTPPTLVLLDFQGKQLSSEEFAGFLDHHQSRGT